jgi:hypothetical protein
MKHNMIRKMLIQKKLQNIHDKLTKNVDNQSIIDRFWKMWRLNYFSNIRINKHDFEKVKNDYHRINHKK